MRILLLSIALTFSAIVPATGQDNGPDLEAARRMAAHTFQSAQALKLENRFNEARRAFEGLAASKDAGTEQWADLAADELGYGLLLHEANYWLLQLGAGRTNDRARESYLTNAEQLYQQILAGNGHNVERMRDIQQRLDQLYVTRQALSNASNNEAVSHLSRLRMYMTEHYLSRGEWPSQVELAGELKETLKQARLAPNRFLIKNYWHTKNDFYALLKDMNGGPDIKITGDANGSRLERASP